MLITFDDGYKNFFERALPVLEELGLPATCFIIASKVDGPNDPEFMSVEDLHFLLRGGLIEIGSHSLTHRSIAKSPYAERVRELSVSKEILGRELSYEVRYFCYPYGTFSDVDRSCANLVRDSGYALGFSSINGINLIGCDRFIIKRTKIEWGDDMVTFKRILQGGIDPWFLVDFLFRKLQKPRSVRFPGT